MIDLKDFAEARLRSIRSRFSPSVATILGYDEEVVKNFEDSLLPEISTIVISSICLNSYNPSISKTNTAYIPEISKAFNIPSLDIFCAYELYGGTFVDIAKVFPSIRAFKVGGICFTPKSIKSHPSGVDMDKELKTKSDVVKKQRILDESYIAGLNPEKR